MDFSIKPEGTWPVQGTPGISFPGGKALPAAGEAHSPLPADALQKGVPGDEGLYSSSLKFPGAPVGEEKSDTSAELRFDEDSLTDDLTGSLSWKRTFGSSKGERDNPATLTQTEAAVQDSGASFAGKKAIINQMVGRDCDPADRGLIEDALSSYSIENLLLLSQHNARYNVRKLSEMPADFNGIRVKEHFMKGHRALIDDYVRVMVKKYDELKVITPETMSYTRKERFLKEQVTQRNLTLGNRDRDFGQMSLITADNVDEIEHISRNAACAIHDEGSDQSEVFLLQHGLSKGVIVHETAHILDSLKHPAPVEAGPASKGLPGKEAALSQKLITSKAESSGDGPDAGLWGSQCDEALKQHYESFIRECSRHPEKRWSDYALSRNMDITEYLAEAVRMYVEKPMVLQAADPDMFAFARTFVEKAEYQSLNFRDTSAG